MSINNRENTRHNFRPIMWVKINRVGAKPADFKMFKLIDVSKSGISFICHDSTEFKRHDVFHIEEIENEILEQPLRAVVKYVKGLDEFGIDFKVGAEFIAKAKAPKK